MLAIISISVDKPLHHGMRTVCIVDGTMAMTSSLQSVNSMHNVLCRYEYSLGLMSTQGFGFNFLSNTSMLGARINSSDNTRQDLDYSSCMPMTVFLPTRGRVEVYKDSRLISSYYYEAGVQQLNTTDFPSGAYNIEIRVVSDTGKVPSSEIQFLLQSQLPPLNEWLYFLEVGQVASSVNSAWLPDTTSQWIGRLGLITELLIHGH